MIVFGQNREKRLSLYVEQVNQLVSTARGAVITTTPGQDYIYRIKEEAALSFQAGNRSEETLKLLGAPASLEITGISEAAEVIVAKSKTSRLKLAELEQLRSSFLALKVTTTSQSKEILSELENQVKEFMENEKAAIAAKFDDSGLLPDATSKK